MRFLNKKNYIILVLLIIFSVESKCFARDSKIQYSSDNISNYFLGIVSTNLEYNEKAFGHLNKVKLLTNRHTQFNIEYIRTLILLEKFKQAFFFSNNVWADEVLLFEIDLLLGLNSFLKKDYKNAEKYFERLNKISRYNLHFDDFFGNILIAWTKAVQGNNEESFKYIDRIPAPYYHLKKTQDILLQCFFDSKDHLGIIHVADNNRLYPGNGHIPWSDLISSLQSINYKGYLSLQIKMVPDFETAAKLGIDYLRSVM